MTTAFDGLGLRLGALYAAHRIGLPSNLLHHMLLGGRIGAGTRIGRGSCVLARTMRTGSNVRIGAHSDIVADEIEIGDGVVIGDHVTIRCRRLRLEAKSRIDMRTHVYGVNTPNSALELGPSAWIFSDCYINTDERVTFGAGSAMGGRSLIFTHGSYLPITAGYPVTVAPVSIGACVWLPWQVFILPGSQIGDGATVGACALISGVIPANSLAVGVPARIIKDASSFRRRYDAPGMHALGLRVLQTCLTNLVGSFRAKELFRPVTRTVVADGDGAWRLHRGNESLRVVYAGTAPDAISPSIQPGTLVVTAGAKFDPPAGVWWMDLTSLEAALPSSEPALVSELRHALGNYGIRFDWLPPGYSVPELPERNAP